AGRGVTEAVKRAVEAAHSRVTFSFGRNWKSYSRFVSDDAIHHARNDIVDWLGTGGVSGKYIVDIGCGSGIHSLAFHQLGAASLLSIDADRDSVECTRRFWTTAGQPGEWRIQQGSILDTSTLTGVGAFDVVYSWGVL